MYSRKRKGGNFIDIFLQMYLQFHRIVVNLCNFNVNRKIEQPAVDYVFYSLLGFT